MLFAEQDDESLYARIWYLAREDGATVDNVLEKVEDKTHRVVFYT